MRPPTGLDFCTRDEEEKSLLMLTDPPAVTAATQAIAAAGAIGYGSFGYGKKDELKEEEDKVVELEKHTRYGLDMALSQQQQLRRGRNGAQRERLLLCTKERDELPAHYFFSNLGRPTQLFSKANKKRLLCTKERAKLGPQLPEN